MIVIETFEPGHGAARLEATARPQFHPARPASATEKSSRLHPAGLAVGQILAIQQTAQRPQATLPPSNPHRPNRPYRPRLIPPRFPPLRLVRRLPTEFAAHACIRQASDNP